MSQYIPVVFAWLGGQRDNVGDSALRRAYADSLRKIGPLTVWSGGPEEDYDAGLRLASGDRIMSTFAGWLGLIYRAALTGRKDVVALNAGEYTLTHRYFVKSVLLFPAAALLRRRGGYVVWAGAAVPHVRGKYTPLFRRYARLVDVLYWRDNGTSESLIQASTMPDWAFALPPAHTRSVHAPGASGHYLTISLRYDRPMPSAEWLAAVSALASRLKLRPIVVTQVVRDSDRSRALALALGAQCDDWIGGAHWEREQKLREIYADSMLVISDRLHVLIIAATEGAIPLGWTESATSKIRRHFDEVGLPWVATCDAVGAIDQFGPRDAEECVAQVDAAVTRSRARVVDVQAAIADVPRRVHEPA